MGHPSDGGHHPMEQRWMDGDGHILLRFLPKAVTGTCPGRDFSEMLNVVTTWVPSCSSPTVPSFLLYGDSQVRRAAAAPCAPAAYLSSFLFLGVQNAAVGADNPNPHCLRDHLLAAARHGRRCRAAEGPPLCWALCVQIIPKWVGLLTDGKVV